MLAPAPHLRGNHVILSLWWQADSNQLAAGCLHSPHTLRRGLHWMPYRSHLELLRDHGVNKSCIPPGCLQGHQLWLEFFLQWCSFCNFVQKKPCDIFYVSLFHTSYWPAYLHIGCRILYQGLPEDLHIQWRRRKLSSWVLPHWQAPATLS